MICTVPTVQRHYFFLRAPDAQWYVWDAVRGTRVNQDHQREVEDCALSDISRALARHHEKQAPLAARDNFMKQMTDSGGGGESRPPPPPPTHAAVARNDSAGHRQLSRADSQIQIGGSFTR